MLSTANAHYCDCRGPRSVDPQTSRCLTCGRLVMADPVRLDTPPRNDRPRSSPSAAYRRGISEGKFHPGGYVPYVPEPASTPPTAPAVDQVAQADGDEPSYVFDSPTKRAYCRCGGLAVWLTSAQPPTACAFCEHRLESGR